MNIDEQIPTQSYARGPALPLLELTIGDLLHRTADRFGDRLELIRRKLLFQLGLEQVALPPRRGRQKNQAVDGDAPRRQDRDQTALAVSDQYNP